MPINILMPALSPTMEEGNLAKWHVKEGDKVKSGDMLAEIETDKATIEFEAVDEGTIGKIVAPEGTEHIKVNEVIAVLLSEGEDKSAIGRRAPAAPPAAPAPAASAAPAAPALAPHRALVEIVKPSAEFKQRLNEAAATRFTCCRRRPYLRITLGAPACTRSRPRSARACAAPALTGAS